MDYVNVTLDKPRRLRFDINALCDAEEVLDRPLGAILASFRAISKRDLRALVWSGLRHEDPALTLQRAGELIQEYCAKGEMADLRELVDKALVKSGAFGRADRLEAEQAAAAARRTAQRTPPADPPSADAASPTSPAS